MWGIIAGFIENLFWSLWSSRKRNEAQNADNNVSAMDDDAVRKRLRDDYTRK
jgi:hypothetical protein